MSGEVPPTASTPRTITVALCASAKKHRQSFDALREAGKIHNARVLQSRSTTVQSNESKVEGNEAPQRGVNAQLQKGLRGAATGEGATSSGYPEPDPALRKATDNATITALESPRRSIAAEHLFRFVDLQYDAQRHMMVLDGVTGTGEQYLLPACAHGGGEAKPKPAQGSPCGSSGASGDVAEYGAARVAASQDSLDDEVDVVLHKVTTFGLPSATRALERWCTAVQTRRSRQRRPHLVVLDPLEKMQLIMTRSLLCRLLDNAGVDGHPVVPIPRTFLWDCRSDKAQCGAGQKDKGGALTPLGIDSFVLMDEEEQKKMKANGSEGGRWWIMKPDEGTGPAFTHHLVMWRSGGAEVTVPAAVRAVLPSEARRFIVQELYVYALPVLLKVYCISSHIYVKAKPTVNLLAHLWEKTGGATAVDVPVMMDSQDNIFFSAMPSSQTCPTEHKAAAGDAAELPAPDTSKTTNSSASSPPIAWDSMIAPDENWADFLSPGTPAYATISSIAEDLAGGAGLGLTLYGFDILLVPSHLTHAYQRKGVRGIGRSEGTMVRGESMASSLSRLAHRNFRSPAASPRRSLAKEQHAQVETESTARAAAPQPFQASDMFDMSSGKPTPLLLDCVPIVVDVNYFPSYKDTGEANGRILELIAENAARVRDGSDKVVKSTSATGRARGGRCSCLVL